MFDTHLIPDGFWLVWSNEHKAYWKPGAMGYTRREDEAGRYPAENAKAICDKALDGRFDLSYDGTIPPEVMVPAPELVSFMTSGLSAKQIVQKAQSIVDPDKDLPQSGLSMQLIALAIRLVVRPHYPEWLFNGYRVYQAMTPREKSKTTAATVSDVLDAIKKVMDEDGQ